MGPEGCCPLEIAIQTPSPEPDFVDFLLAAGADPNGSPHNRGGAASPRNSRARIAAGAKVDASAAHELVFNDTASVASMELLLAHGLDLSTMDPNALLATAAFHSLPMLNLLRRQGLCFTPSYADRSLLASVAKYNVEEPVAIIHTLAALGLNVRAVAGTALHSAIRNPRVLCTLLECGADVDARDSYDCTPLQVASADATAVEAVHALLLAGADETLVNKFGGLCSPDWSRLRPKAQKLP